MRPAALASLALAAACTGSAPTPPPLEMPPNDVFNRLFKRAPTATVKLPLTLDTKSCAFALYTAATQSGPVPFVMIHPLRTQCELWLGRIGFVFEYCLYPREGLVEIEGLAQGLFRIDDDEHCIF